MEYTKQQAECRATGLYVFRNRSHKVVGFRCECGCEFQQERLITQEIRKRHISPEACWRMHACLGRRREAKECLREAVESQNRFLASRDKENEGDL